MMPSLRTAHTPDRLTSLLRALAMLLLIVFSAAGSAQARDTPVMLVLGDSLSASHGIAVEDGWVSLLEQRLESSGNPHVLINASIGGETTRGGLTRLPAMLERHQPDWVIISLGGNDGLRGIPLDEMRANLSRMIEMAKQAQAKVLLVGIRIPPNLGRQYTQRFHQSFHDLADSHEVPLVPFLLEDVALTPGMMQSDGIHPTAEAQTIMLDNVWKILQPQL